eukprot:Selendium_serpulae@DN6433_c0_g1_i10.p1
MDDLTSTESIRRNQSSTPAPSSESRRHIISSNNRISSPQFAMVIPQSMNTRDVMSSSTSSVFTRCEMPNFSHSRASDKWLPEYLEGHTSMLKGCVDNSFIHLRDITTNSNRKRAYSCPAVVQVSSYSSLENADAHCPSLDGSNSFPRRRDGLEITEKNVNVLMYKPKSVDSQKSSKLAPSIANPIVQAIENSQYSDVYFEDLTKLQRRALKDEQPVASKGSGFHELNTCKPCVFFWASKGCKNGDNCSFCHNYHASKKKAKKMKHARSNRRVALLAPEAVILSHQNSPQCAGMSPVSANSLMSPSFGSSLGAPSTASSPKGQSSPSFGSSFGSSPSSGGLSWASSSSSSGYDVLYCPVLCDVKRWRETHHLRPATNFQHGKSYSSDNYWICCFEECWYRVRKDSKELCAVLGRQGRVLPPL